MKIIPDTYLSATLLIFALALHSPAAAGLESGYSSSPADSGYRQADSLALAGDSAAALTLLHRALALDPKHYESRLARGNLLLNRGELDAAREDYTQALFSDSCRIRALAHTGLGNILRRMSNKNYEAVKEYRLAAAADSANCEALYLLAQTGFELKESSGYIVADNALAELICRDPEYRDAYALWRDKIRGKSPGNLRMVASGLPGIISRNPGLNRLWLDFAYDWFSLFETANTLAALDSLEAKAPLYKPQERLLLRARCLLELGDTLAFETLYDQAVGAAVQESDFERLILEAATIFTPDEQSSFGRMITPEQMAAFFRVFWRNKGPDPVTFRNERLLEHYVRLRTAEKEYKQLTPNSLAQTSADYLRLMSRSAEQSDGSFDEFPYEYDPVKVFKGRSPALELDHRGLLFVRHGPPSYIDRIYIRDDRDGMVEALSAVNLHKPIAFNSERWVYWPNYFYFKSGLGTGGYLYYPMQSRDVGNIEQAMDTQTFKEPLPLEPQDYYSAAFLRRDGRLDLEFYQSHPVHDSKTDEPPPALLALYDRSLDELGRDSTRAVKANRAGESIWIAVNSLTVVPRDYSFALSLGLPNVRASVRNNIWVQPLTGMPIELSGIILGSPPEPGPPVHQRSGIDILPRPSLKFKTGEIMTVYFEIYGLAADIKGDMSFKERVNVALEKEKKGVARTLVTLGRKRTGNRTLTFERTPKTTASVAVESYTIDTSLLLPGAYRMIIEIEDSHSGRKKQTGCSFELDD